MTVDRYALLWVDLGVLFGLAWLVCLLIKNPLVRQTACRGAIVGSIILSLIVVISSERTAPIAPVEAKMIVASAMAVPEAIPAIGSTKSAPASSGTVSEVDPKLMASQIASQLSDPDERTFAPVYFIGLCLMAAVYIASWRRLRVLHSSSSAQLDPRLKLIAERVALRLGMEDLRIRVLPSDQSVFVAGMFRPTVYAGEAWIDSQSDANLEAFLLHEAAHIVRGDLRWQTFHRLIRVFFWLQPFVWLIAKGLNRSAEELCDRHVVVAGIEPAHYADGLLKVAEMRRAPVGAYGLFGTKAGLSKRIEALVSGANLRIVQMNSRARVLSAMVVILAVSTIGYVFAVPQGSDDPNAPQPSTRVVTFIGPDGKPMKEGRVTYLSYRTFNDVEEKHLKLVNGSVKVRCQNLRFGMEYLCVESPKIGLSCCYLARQSPEKMTLKCSKPTSIVGKLIQSSGQPAANVRVQIRMVVDCVNQGNIALLPGSSVSKRLTQVTDNNGTYRFDGMPADAEIYLVVDDNRYAQLDYQFRAFTGGEDNYRSENGKVYKAETYEALQAKLKARKIGYREITHVPPIRLRPAATIEGRVTRDGKPVAGVPVQHEVVDQSGIMPIPVTDENGYYKIEQVRSGTVNVLPNLDSKRNGEVAAMPRVGLKVAEGQHLKGIDFELTSGAVLDGTMFGKNGKPLPFGLVVIQPGEPPCTLIVAKYCDKNGHYRVHVGPGRIRMMGGIDFTIADGETKTVDVHYPSEVPVQYAK